MVKIKALASVALMAAVLLGLARIKTLSAKNDYLSRRLADTEQLNQALSAEISAGRAALSAREAERKRLAEESAALQQKLEFYNNDPHVKIWSDTLCPAPILNCLRP